MFQRIIQFLCYLFERLWDAVEVVQKIFLGIFFRTEFVRQGQCQMTGQCCRNIGMEVPRLWLKRLRLLKWIRRWHQLRYRFEYQGVQGNMLVYSCRDLTVDKHCGIHWMKPKLCRDYPPTPLFGFAKLHKGCGFYFAKRQGKDFGNVLRSRTAKGK